MILKRWANKLKEKLSEDYGVKFQKKRMGLVNLEELSINYGEGKPAELRNEVERFIKIERISNFFMGTGLFIGLVLACMFLIVLMTPSQREFL